MKKLLTLALALVALTVFTGLSVGQGAQQKDKQKSPPTSGETKQPAAEAKNSAHAMETMMTGTVTQVNEKAKTFTVMANGKEVTFSAKEMRALPAVGDVIDITYTQTPGGPLVATSNCCVRGSKSNSSDRVLSQQGRVDDKGSTKVMTGKVLRVNEKAKTFTVMANGKEVTFSAREMKALPEVGRIIDITYTQTTPGGPLNSISLNSSRSNIY
jgi:hypothetical protein